ncbi:protein LATERAL ROOT PRIMORDIUM 1-like [Zingiber officinale]|nr:protein LATERAL ROOT PRIMORDIUM 1-like [Zingiber officinale]XP_042425082.1 protein LATERAL ROOT PRIMORDIUM 1-like [Zingiber officinale]XP_042425083.1 protein LATERAL ROOT PRIMORDIUM 1-like [Zingiber officinale]
MGTVVLASAASFHPQHHHHETLLSTAATEHHPAIIPLLAATPCIVDDDNPASQGKLGGGIHVWQPAQPQATTYHHHGHPFPPYHETNPNPSPNPTLYNYLRKPVPMLESRVILGATAGAGVFTCQDCGNQAKKDCSHRRCRTCCKSRGFDCSTHVKSTWVPAARRRERQLTVAAAAGSSTSTSAPKKARLVSSQPATASHTSTSNTTPRSFDTTSSHQDAGVKENLPGHVRAPALFKCVRVTSIDDGEDEYAYHAMVKIGGRVFKGFLYDHGLDDGGGGHSDDGKEGSIPNLSELHLGNRLAGASSSSPMLPSSSDAFGGGLVGSANYDNQIN